MISYILNLDIKNDIQKNILDYQRKLWVKTMSLIRQKNFKHWLKTKEDFFPSNEIMFQFNNLYFNYQLNKLIKENNKIFARDYKNIEKKWIKNLEEKFWFLNEKFKLQENLTEKEFELFFDSEKSF